MFSRIRLTLQELLLVARAWSGSDITSPIHFAWRFLEGNSWLSLRFQVFRNGFGVQTKAHWSQLLERMSFNIIQLHTSVWIKFKVTNSLISWSSWGLLLMRSGSHTDFCSTQIVLDVLAQLVQNSWVNTPDNCPSCCILCITNCRGEDDHLANEPNSLVTNPYAIPYDIPYVRQSLPGKL